MQIVFVVQTTEPDTYHDTTSTKPFKAVLFRCEFFQKWSLFNNFYMGGGRGGHHNINLTSLPDKTQVVSISNNSYEINASH